MRLILAPMDGLADHSLRDILTRLGEAFAYRDLEWSTLDFAGTPARVVTPQTLYRMKKDTVRLKDRADAEALRRRFGLEDEA